MKLACPESQMRSVSGCGNIGGGGSGSEAEFAGAEGSGASWARRSGEISKRNPASAIARQYLCRASPQDILSIRARVPSHETRGGELDSRIARLQTDERPVERLQC